MTSPRSADDLARAIQLHRAGQTADAIHLLEKVVRKVPRHANALHMLGIAYVQCGKAAEGASALEKAVALKPDLPDAHYNLGTVLQSLRRYEEARRYYELALGRAPDDAEIHCNLGTAVSALGRHGEAIGHFGKALALRANYPEAHFNLGNAWLALRELENACGAFEKAVKLRPGFAAALLNWGIALAALERHDDAADLFQRVVAIAPADALGQYNLANSLQMLGRHEAAVARYEKAAVLNPDLPDVHVKFGNSLNALDRNEEAVAHYRKALALRADDIEAHCNLGNALQALGRYDESVAVYRRAIAFDPENGQVHFNLANALQLLDRNEEALQSYERAIAHLADPTTAKQIKGILNLSLGRFGEGWDVLETRFEAQSVVPRAYPQPRWNGGPVEGQLLVWGEQGLGEQIIFSSMLPDLHAYATSIVLEVEPRLVTLFARSFPGIEVIPLGQELYAGTIDAHDSLVSLGRYLRRNWESFGTPQRGYLLPDAGRTVELRRRLSHDGKRVVGLSWLSHSPAFGAGKSARLIDFAAALRLPNCRFVDLQYGETRVERASVAADIGVEVDRLGDIDNTNDIDGLAALISACDLVLTVSNTTAHLCGALGKPCFVLVPVDKFRIWYWFKERPQSPWYACVRTIRQKVGQPWSDMVSAVLPEISELLRWP